MEEDTPRSLIRSVLSTRDVSQSVMRPRKQSGKGSMSETDNRRKSRGEKRKSMTSNDEEETPRTLINKFLQGHQTVVQSTRKRSRVTSERTPETWAQQKASTSNARRRVSSVPDLRRRSITNRMRQTPGKDSTPRTTIRDFLENASEETPFHPPARRQSPRKTPQSLQKQIQRSAIKNRSRLSESDHGQSDVVPSLRHTPNISRKKKRQISLDAFAAGVQTLSQRENSDEEISDSALGSIQEEEEEEEHEAMYRDRLMDNNKNDNDADDIDKFKSNQRKRTPKSKLSRSLGGRDRIHDLGEKIVEEEDGNEDQEENEEDVDEEQEIDENEVDEQIEVASVDGEQEDGSKDDKQIEEADVEEQEEDENEDGGQNEEEGVEEREAEEDGVLTDDDEDENEGDASKRSRQENEQDDYDEEEQDEESENEEQETSYRSRHASNKTLGPEYTPLHIPANIPQRPRSMSTPKAKVMPSSRKDVRPALTSVSLGAADRMGIGKPNQAEKERKKPTRRTPAEGGKPVRLPTALTKGIFSHFAKGRITKDVIREVEKVSDQFWANLSDDLAAYSQHAKRQTIEESDVELLMRRQGFVTDSQSMYTLVEKYLPLEYRQEIIPIARYNNIVVPRQ
ncbi:centromere protein T [Lingula anatina]|uniref:Centromere protein T n=1 Tax=Lingula anatina TaxID=7574 RepID=A0A1S3I9C8_LINAN|nr:centromere protein T [Lingula anatina]|eukprot:XP_013394857.1 centromere protein T [Lingula anatina]